MLKIPTKHMFVIVFGKRPLSADTALRLARHFRTSAELWMNLQTMYDLDLARRKMRQGSRPHPATAERAHLLAACCRRQRTVALFWRFLLGVLVVGALRGVLVVVAQPGELLVEGLDGGFLLAENLFDQVMPVGFERLLLGKEFFNVGFRGFTRSAGLRRGSRRLLGHVVYHGIPRLPAGGRSLLPG